MKKLILFIALSLTLTANSYAQVTVGAIGEIATPLKPIGGRFLKSLGAVIVTNKGKLGAGTIVLGGIGFGLYELKKHPEIIESHLASYPEDIPNVVNKLSQYDWGMDYLDQMGIGDHYAQTQLDLENTQEWKDARVAVEQIAVTVDKE